MVRLWDWRGRRRVGSRAAPGVNPYLQDRTFTIIYLPVVVFTAFAAAADWASFATLLCISDSLFQPVVTT